MYPKTLNLSYVKGMPFSLKLTCAEVFALVGKKFGAKAVVMG